MSMSTPSATTAFTGTAADYAGCRPPYPDAFLRELRSCAGTTGVGSLVDLACGPGRVAIPMAPYFKSVLAVDVEAEMIVVGEHAARGRGATNISWRVECAEALQLIDGSIELITIGEAFHRLNQQHILKLAVQWLQPHGALATLGAEPVWRGSEAWRQVLVDVVNKWTRGALGDPNSQPWGGPSDELRAAGLQIEEREFVIDHVWTCDSIVGFMFSTSIASRRVLGERASHFESELRSALFDADSGGRFASRQRFGFTLGKRGG